LTVLFCDLVGSTPLSARLDPEELREVIRAYQETCTETIHRFEGYVARYIGDGILIYFGYPLAHEDGARRAVHAGLQIVEALPELNAHLREAFPILQTAPLEVRIGIHTGLVVVGEMGAGANLDPAAIVGEAPNIAARLQSLAEPNSVMLSAATYRLIEGFFECRDCVYQALNETEVQSRFEVAVAAGLTPFIGRGQELHLLHERWERAKAGLGQIVLLNGEPGIGKSRLVQVLKEYLVKEKPLQLTGQCSSYAQHSAFSLIINLLQRLLQFSRLDTPQIKLRKLEDVLTRSRLSLPENVPLLATLLSLPLPNHYRPLTLTPQRQRQKTMEVFLSWIRAMAEEQPIVLVGEDLHWSDPSSLELLNLLIDQTPQARLLILLTARPDFSPPWQPASHIIEITLSRLSKTQTEVLVAEVTHGKALPVEVQRQLVTKTDGVPLFVEEFTKFVLESNWIKEEEDRYSLTGEQPPVGVPTALHDPLMARLDRLGATVKEVAQLGAILGREFSYELLHAVSPVTEETLLLGLSRLIEAKLLYEGGSPIQRQYQFKHPLIQEAAYQSLLKTRRQHYHARIAQVLTAQFPDLHERQPELAAQHYTAAGLIEPAILSWQKAGQQALERSANVEAISHLGKGLELLRTHPNTPERAQQELCLWTTLGPAFIATKGYAAPEVANAYARARELCQQVGETPQLFPVLWGLWVFHHVGAELKTARNFGEQLLRLAHNARDSALLLEAHAALAQTLYLQGEFTLADAHVTAGVTLYDPQQHGSHAFLYGEDPGVVCQGLSAWILWFLGYPDQANQRIDQALRLARTLPHPFSFAEALSIAATLSVFRREEQAVLQLTEEIIPLSIEQEFPFWLAVGQIHQGSARHRQQQDKKHVEQMREGISTYQATGAAMGWPYYLAHLAEAYGREGQAKEGLRLLEEALDIVHSSGESFYEAELYRLKGELLLLSQAA
jgi:predicted ATPase/class 3 adenylate cyclase